MTEGAQAEEGFIAKPRKTKLIIAVIALVSIIIIGVFFAVRILNFDVPSESTEEPFIPSESTEEPIEKPFIVEAPSVTEGWNLIAQYSSEEYTQYDNVTYPSPTGDIPYREITLNLHITYDTFNVKYKVVSNGAWKIIHRYYWDSRVYGGSSGGSTSAGGHYTRYLYVNDQVTPSQDITLTLAFSESIESWAITIEGK